MAEINQFDITEEELAEIEQIKELAQGCSDYLLNSLINVETGEKVQLEKEDKEHIYKLILSETMKYVDTNSFPENQEDFDEYINFIITHIQ